MAFGFPPKHTDAITFEGTDPSDVRPIVLAAFNNLGWQVSTAATSSITGFAPSSLSLWGEQITISITGSDVSITSQCLDNSLFDLGKNRKNVDSFIEACKTILESATSKELEKYRSDELKPSEEAHAETTPVAKTSAIADIVELFRFRPGYIATPLIADINILIFIIMAISGVGVFFPTGESLLSWGANFRPLTIDGQWWRLFTSCFLHFGILHLMMNLYALCYVGLLLEPMIGRTRFIFAYLVTGIVGSVVSVLFHEAVISAGASGAIFGMYGLFLAMLTTNLIEKESRKPLIMSIGLFVGYNLLNGLKSGIDNAAHLGGLISGLLIGYSYYYGMKKQENQMMVIGPPIFALVILLIVSISFLGQTTSDIGTYDKFMHSFANIEQESTAAFRSAGQMPPEAAFSVISYRVVPKWKEALAIVDSLERLKIPESLQQKNKLLRKYCGLQIGFCDKIALSLKNNTEMSHQEVKNTIDQINEVVRELKITNSNSPQ